MILDKIKNRHLYSTANQRLSEAFDFIEKTDFSDVKPGRIDVKGEELFVLVNEYTTKKNELNVLEAHKKYIDLQYIISGTEVIEYELFDNHTVSTAYVDKDDYALFVPKKSVPLKVSKGDFVIFYPEDLHLPTVAYNDTPVEVKKIVFKILID